MTYLGAFAEVLGIRPWEWDLLDAHEALALISYIERRDKSDGG